MLRLKNLRFINPGHIASVDLSEKEVAIYMIDDREQRVTLETEEQAKCFAAYVELLVDFTNGQITVEGSVRKLEYYFQKKGVLTPSHRDTALNKIRKESN